MFKRRQFDQRGSLSVRSCRPPLMAVFMEALFGYEFTNHVPAPVDRFSIDTQRLSSVDK